LAIGLADNLHIRARVSQIPASTDTKHIRKPFCLGDFEMLSIFRKLMKNEQGATAIEYVLIASLISVAAIAAMTSVGGKVSNVLSNVASAMN
jgi:pilus assembly protein Flp/PilA